MNTSYEDRWKQWVADWQKRYQEMQVQFSLGKMDATEAFEKQKEMLRGAIVQWKDELDKGADKADAYVQEMRAKAEALKVQLNLGKAEGMDKFNAQRKEIEALLNEIKAKSKKSYNENFDKALDLFEHNSKAFKTGLEVLQLQFSLAKMDAKADAAEIKKQVEGKLNDLNQSYKELQKMGMENLEAWRKQAQENYDQVKSWAEEWMSKLKK